jgi:hypothetical protein
MANDIASNTAYDDGFQNGDNGGFGFDAWSWSTGADPNTFSGAFIGNAATNFGDINTSNESFGIFAHRNGQPSGNVFANIRRNNPSGLTTGDALSAVITTSFRNGSKGMVIYQNTTWSEPADVLWAFRAESNEYRVNGVQPAEFSTYDARSIFTIVARQTSSTGGDVTITRSGTSVTIPFTGVIRGFKFYNANTENVTDNNNLYFNSMRLYRY